MSQTTIRVSSETRDSIAALAEELGGVPLDEALKIALWERAALLAVERLKADPEALAEYQAEAHEWAELDVAVID